MSCPKTGETHRAICPNLETNHSHLIRLYRKAREIEGVHQLEGLGYTGTRNRTISVTNSKNAELYRLIVASKNPLGDKIWRSITQHTSRGQRGFDL